MIPAPVFLTVPTFPSTAFTVRSLVASVPRATSKVWVPLSRLKKPPVALIWLRAPPVVRKRFPRLTKLAAEFSRMPPPFVPNTKVSWLKSYRFPVICTVAPFPMLIAPPE